MAAVADKPTISAVIITRNEAEMIAGCLDSLSFCDEIVVVDSLSTDGTQEICRARGARVIERPFTGFGDQKEFARQQASCDWVLSMDADERITEPLKAEILAAVAALDCEAYRIARLSYFLGKPFYHSGWWPDKPLRLFRRDVAWFNSKMVHEFAETDRPMRELASPMDHFTIRSIEQAVAKHHHYAVLGAAQVERAGGRVTLLTPFAHSIAAFVKTYVIKRGFLGGVEGYANARIRSQTAFWKYMFVYMNRAAARRRQT